jgi:hypothetical protein
MSVQDKIQQEISIIKTLKREILKHAKKNETFHYWDISSLSDSMVKSIIIELEKDGKNVNSKGPNYKVIRW